MNLRCARIGLGSVQWGMKYGVANNNYQTSIDEVGRIINAGRALGIRVIDTAVLYGEAEALLGKQDLTALRIVTKTRRYARATLTAADAKDLKDTLERSLARLNLFSVYGLLAHHVEDLLGPGSEWLIDAMQSLRQAGKVQRIGVSVYDGAQIEAVLERFTPDLVQLPINVFDQRLINDGSLQKLSSLGIEVHARSAFLQGLLLMHPDSAPTYFDPWRERLRSWHNSCAEANILPHHAALAFVCDQPEINCCLIGAQNLSQLNQCLEGLEAAESFNVAGLACDDLALVNPANWRLN